MRSTRLGILLALLAMVGTSKALPQAPPDLDRHVDSQVPSIVVPGHAFHIGFPEDRNPFIYQTSGITETYEKRPDGSKANRRPAPWSMKVKLDIFRVLRVGPGSWLLVEHPLSPKDYASWIGQHRAGLLLEEPGKLDADRVELLRESLEREIKLTQTWVNLQHAITLKQVSRDSLGITSE